MANLDEQANDVFDVAYKASEGNLRLARQTTGTFIEGSRESDKPSAYRILRGKVEEVVSSFFRGIKPDASYLTRCTSYVDLSQVEFDSSITVSAVL